jgi:glycosyltransferase involved in cell wall biosynthesis
MKICVLHNHYYRSSGSAVIIRRITEAFRGSAVDFIFAGCRAPAEGGTAAEEDLSWIPDGKYAHFDLMGRPPGLPGEAMKFIRWIKQNQCDVIHVHHRRLAALVNLTSRYHGTPFLFTAHNTFPLSLWFWAFAPKDTSGVSPSVVNYLKRNTRAKNPLLTWNPFPFSLQAPAPKDLSLAWNTAISVGRLEPVKGQLNLVLAWKKLQSLGVRPQLNIFGEGYLRPQLEATIRTLGLQDQVHLRGFASDLSKEFSSSLFNILASSTEGFPNVVVEASATNTATLLTDVDGSRDAVPPDVMLPNKVKIGEVDALADHLAKWFANPEAAIADGVAFRRFMMQRCSMDAVRDTYTQIYTRLVAGVDSPSGSPHYGLFPETASRAIGD